MGEQYNDSASVLHAPEIFDVIEKVNDKMCSGLHIPGVDPQESFDEHVKVRAIIVTLHLLHSVALPSMHF